MIGDKILTTEREIANANLRNDLSQTFLQSYVFDSVPLQLNKNKLNSICHHTRCLHIACFEIKTKTLDYMNAQEKADAFVAELREVIERHYGKLPPNEVEPFGMRLRQVLPMVSSGAAGSVTTTATISLPPDTDPPDSDD
jgi:hypothetical protein